MTKTPFTGYKEKASDILNFVHTDVHDLMSTQARGGFSYFIICTNDRSRFGYVYLMKYKSEAHHCRRQLRIKINSNYINRVSRNYFHRDLK